MKGCIKVLKDQPPNSVEGLLNALRWARRETQTRVTLASRQLSNPQTPPLQKKKEKKAKHMRHFILPAARADLVSHLYRPYFPNVVWQEDFSRGQHLFSGKNPRKRRWRLAGAAVKEGRQSGPDILMHHVSSSPASRGGGGWLTCLEELL